LCNKKNELYKPSTLNLEGSVNYIAQKDIDTTRLWHYWLGYISYDRLQKIAAKGRATGIPYIPMYQEVRGQCQEGKQARENFPCQSTS